MGSQNFWLVELRELSFLQDKIKLQLTNKSNKNQVSEILSFRYEHVSILKKCQLVRKINIPELGGPSKRTETNPAVSVALAC